MGNKHEMDPFDLAEEQVRQAQTWRDEKKKDLEEAVDEQNTGKRLNRPIEKIKLKKPVL